MEPFRDRRADMMTEAVPHKPPGMALFTCVECRRYKPYSELAGHYRCRDCCNNRADRLAAHTKRIRKEMNRRYNRETEFTDVELESLLCK